MRRTPWLLTRVCRYWSTVALSMPALWSCLDLTLDCIGENGTVPLTELQIQRSQNMPLTLTIRDEEGPGAQDSHPVLQLALSASHRWKVADLHMKPSLFQQMTAACGFSSLTTLLITINLSPDDRFGEVSDFDDAFWNLFSAAPELRCVRALCWSDFGLTTAPFILPWQQLTHLSTAFASNTEALTMLGKLPNIIQCTLTLSESNLLIEEDDPPVVYHKHTSVLDFLETPTLTSLTVYLTADEEAILGLVTRSNSQSTTTWLYTSQRKLPHLTSLELGDFDGTLFPRSSMPDFVKAFSKQWLELQAAVRDHTLSMQIVDRSFEKEDARRLTSKLTSLDVHVPGRIRVMERFSY
ncbi:F-box domain-containing protein [Favolaschia claudopus]|uniref:F-box domain-containing protein n=1 Tax=Favolaschia claudopus TaxID=2862362 RepID=A0AAW0CH06_9AGAR